MMYGETRNMTVLTNDVANKTKTLKLLLQYQFDFGLRPSIGYSYSKRQRTLAGWTKILIVVNYIEIGTGTTSIRT